MIKSIKKFIDKQVSQIEKASVTEHDIQLAAATLLFEVIKADHVIEDSEITSVSSLLEKHFSLDKEEVDNLIQLARDSSEEASCLQSFTRTICENYDNKQRCELVQYCWLIAFADGTIDTHERHLIRKIASLLYLNDKQIIQTRESAKRSLALV